MYTLVFAPDVLEDLQSIRSPLERRKVVAAIQCLCADPSTLGIASAVDRSGRVNRIAVIGGIAFTFWADHALARLRVTAIQVVTD